MVVGFVRTCSPLKFLSSVKCLVKPVEVERTSNTEEDFQTDDGRSDDSSQSQLVS